MSNGTEVAVRRPQQQALPAKVEYARTLADSGLLPTSFRRNPANVLWAMEYADMLGLAPMVAMTGVHVIEGTPTASAGLISALVRKAGHKLRVQGNAQSATCQIMRADDPDYVFEVTWTLKRNQDGNPSAEEAGLLGKAVWKNYPASMLKSRAITQCARDACEEALYGLNYTPEELGAEVNEDGEIVEGEVVSDSPRQPAGQDDNPWYVNPPPEQAASAEWAAKSLELIPGIGLEACRTLWKEAADKGNSGEVAAADAKRVRDALALRMETLASAKPAAATTQPDDDVIEGEIVGLDPDDPWAQKIEDLADADEAAESLAEASVLLASEEIDQARFSLIEAEILTRFPEAGKGAEAA